VKTRLQYLRPCARGSEVGDNDEVAGKKVP
jgi:hypothetical protein